MLVSISCEFQRKFHKLLDPKSCEGELWQFNTLFFLVLLKNQQETNWVHIHTVWMCIWIFNIVRRLVFHKNPSSMFRHACCYSCMHSFSITFRKVLHCQFQQREREREMVLSSIHFFIFPFAYSHSAMLSI